MTTMKTTEVTVNPELDEMETDSQSMVDNYHTNLRINTTPSPEQNGFLPNS